MTANVNVTASSNSESRKIATKSGEKDKAEIIPSALNIEFIVKEGNENP